MAFENLLKKQVLLAADSSLWLHDRYGHFAGYLLMGQKRIFEAYWQKLNFVEQLSNFLVFDLKTDLDLKDLKSELAKMWDYATDDFILEFDPQDPTSIDKAAMAILFLTGTERSQIESRLQFILTPKSLPVETYAPLAQMAVQILESLKPKLNTNEFAQAFAKSEQLVSEGSHFEISMAEARAMVKEFIAGLYN